MYTNSLKMFLIHLGLRTQITFLSAELLLLISHASRSRDIQMIQTRESKIFCRS